MYKVKNIRMKGNEHGQLQKDVIYADLYDQNDELKISANLEYILQIIRDHNIKCEGISIVYKRERGEICSSVDLDLYN